MGIFLVILIVCVAAGVVGLWRAYTDYPIKEKPYEREDGSLPEFQTLKDFFEVYGRHKK